MFVFNVFNEAISTSWKLIWRFEFWKPRKRGRFKHIVAVSLSYFLEGMGGQGNENYLHVNFVLKS